MGTMGNGKVFDSFKEVESHDTDLFAVVIPVGECRYSADYHVGVTDGLDLVDLVLLDDLVEEGVELVQEADDLEVDW